MGYMNPARSSPVGMKLDTIDLGYQSFKGLINTNAPFKVISYGIVKYSNLAQASEVCIKKLLFVKLINIFPLPAEWEHMVGFFGMCAGASNPLFAPYQGALPYATHMLPAPGSNGMVGLVLRQSVANSVPGKW